MENKLNIKGLIWFLSLTFIPTIITALIARSMGATFELSTDARPQIILSVAMFFPLIAAVIVQKLILKKDLKSLGFKLGPVKYYLYTFLLIIGLYFLIYGFTWLFIANPDFSMQAFVESYGLGLPMPANQFILIIFFATLFITPLINIIPSLGEELGWRGFLLQGLLPLGKKKALIISGIIWGLWHLPFVLLIGFGYGEHYLMGALLFLLLITLIGVWFGYLRLISGSIWLPTFAHAVFNAQGYGIWIMLWPNINPLIGGKVGVIALFIYAFLAYIIMQKINNKQTHK